MSNKNNLKKVVVVYKGDDWNKKIPFTNDDTRISFEDWYQRGERMGITFFRASIDWYDNQTNTFKKAWTFKNNRWTKTTAAIQPDLIFDKISGQYDYELFNLKMKLAEKAKLFNHPLFRTSLDSKLTQYLILQEFMAKSFLATDKKELSVALKKIKSAKAVLKPIHGSGGFGIIIDNKKNISKKKIAFPVFVQEFIQGDCGIPGFSKNKCLADLRMIFFNHKLIFSLSRVAKKGSPFTNFHQGADAVLVPRKFIPLSVQKMTKQIIKKLSIFPEANYSLDFMFTNSGRPVLVEINTAPGLCLLNIIGNEKIKEANFQEFIKLLK